MRKATPIPLERGRPILASRIERASPARRRNGNNGPHLFPCNYSGAHALRS
jgi:hypothetical protein